MRTLNASLEIYGQKKHNFFKSTNISLLFRSKLIHILIRRVLLHTNCFVCFSIYYMRDVSAACLASVIISIVTQKNKYEINA